MHSFGATSKIAMMTACMHITRKSKHTTYGTVQEMEYSQQHCMIFSETGFARKNR